MRPDDFGLASVRLFQTLSQLQIILVELAKGGVSLHDLQVAFRAEIGRCGHKRQEVLHAAHVIAELCLDFKGGKMVTGQRISVSVQNAASAEFCLRHKCLSGFIRLPEVLAIRLQVDISPGGRVLWSALVNLRWSDMFHADVYFLLRIV